ncbi:SRPBCC family protein [Mesoterricola sediminis]|uniref:Ribosome association toxin RatA n=1 Tax=Mesoterricola sediminis TaxID=2927980 RepID=A0AA48H3U4_9BACT|nr:SRPBCC family protein [Mesoterricola sediminis]BDU76966.1 hypothetical protein METESE_19240 [Mesoterricola sediminis]
MEKTTATSLLRDDHRKVEDLYRRFNQTQDYGQRVGLAEDICKELEIHARLEECLVYPDLAREGAPTGMARHFGDEHGTVKRLISQVRICHAGQAPAFAEDDALVARIMASIEHHIQEEEGTAFPRLEQDPDHNASLGADLATLKMKLKMCPPVFEAIDVEVPARVAYNQWTQFEAFPRFLDAVKEVRQLDDSHVQWRVEIAGKDFGWTAEIYEQIPDERIAWSSVDGAINAGSATFRPLGEGACRILVEMAYEPKGLVEDLGAMLGTVSRNLAAALRKFKDYIETTCREDGAWRGDIAGNPVDPELARQGLPKEEPGTPRPLPGL